MTFTSLVITEPQVPCGHQTAGTQDGETCDPALEELGGIVLIQFVKIPYEKSQDLREKKNVQVPFPRWPVQQI